MNIFIPDWAFALVLSVFIAVVALWPKHKEQGFMDLMPGLYAIAEGAAGVILILVVWVVYLLVH